MSNVKIMQELYSAFGQGDIPSVLGGMDANIEWREAENNPYQPSGAPLDRLRCHIEQPVRQARGRMGWVHSEPQAVP